MPMHAVFYVLCWMSLSLMMCLDIFAQSYRPAPPLLLSQQQKHDLAQRIEPHVVRVTRQSVNRRGINTLGALTQQGGGLRLTSRLVLTADAWLIRSPHERSVLIEVKCGRKQAPTQMVIGEAVNHAPQDGWMLIKLQRALHCDSERFELLDALDLSVEVHPTTREPYLYAGQRVYALEEDPLILSPLMIQGKAGGALAFYWLTTGRIRPGTPLFDQQGRWRTLASGLSRQTQDLSLGTSQSLTLPFDALHNAIKVAKRVHASL